MSVSLSQPIISNDEKSKWYFLQEGPSLQGAVFANQSLSAGVPLIISASKGATIINFDDPDSPGTTLKTITIVSDGDSVEYVPFKTITRFSIYNTLNKGSVVAISERSDISSTANPRLFTYTTSGSVSLTGAGYVLAVGGGGGSGGVCEFVPSPGRIAAGGGGGTGGFDIKYIADLSVITSVTVGAAGTSGTNAYNGSNNSFASAAGGNAGGSSTFGSASATGGGGGGGGTTHLYAFNVGGGGAAGSPLGVAGIAGSGTYDRANQATNAVDPTEYQIESPLFGRIRFANGTRPVVKGYNANIFYSGSTTATSHTIGGYSGADGSGSRSVLGYGVGAPGSGWVSGSLLNYSGAPGVVYVMAGI